MCIRQPFPSLTFPAADVWTYRPESLWPEEYCVEQADDDLDGLVSCQDHDCEGMPCGSGLTCLAGVCQ